MTAVALNYGRKAYPNYYGFVPAGGVSPTYPTNHAVYFVTTAITLKWGLITNANAYQIQVSTSPDFSGSLMVNASGITVHQHSFTDTGTNDGKRWWRWRYSLDGGTHYSRWSEVGSYWINTAGAENVTVSQNTWMLINPSDVTDRNIVADFPVYAIKQGHIYRVRERNRVGTLLSEYITLKSMIQLQYDQRTYMGVDAFFDMRRYNEEIKTFFLATFKNSVIQIPTPNIWKVQFSEDPELTMFATGRQDLYVGTLNFMEV